MAQNIIRGDKKYLWSGEQYDKAISQKDATEDSFWIRFYANADDKCLRVAGDYYETKRQLARMLNYDEYGKYFGKIYQQAGTERMCCGRLSGRGLSSTSAFMWRVLRKTKNAVSHVLS